MQRRYYWIDISKAVLIYLVVVAHSGHISPITDTLICGFHMPAFFIISGMLTSFSGSVKETVIKSYRRLIVPALFFTAICYLIFLSRHLLRGDYDSYACILKPLLGLVIYDRSIASPVCGVIWFLVVLFGAKVLMEYLNTFLRKHLVISVLLILDIVLLYGMDSDFGVFYYVKRLMVALPFLYIGYYLRPYLLRNYSPLKAVLGGVILLLIYVPLCIWNGRVGIHSFVFGHDMVMYYLIAIVGSFSLFLITMPYSGSFAIIEYIAKNTITILCLHRIVLGYTKFIHDGFLQALICVMVLLPVIYVLNRFCPNLIGNK